MAKINFTQEQIKDIIRKYENLESAEKIAIDIGCSSARILRLLKKNNISIRKVKTLSPETIEKIFDLYTKEFYTITEIQKLLHLSSKTIKNVLFKKNILDTKYSYRFYDGLEKLKNPSDSVYQELLYYLIGLLITDGCCSISKKNNIHQLILSLQLKDKECLEKINIYLPNISNLFFPKTRKDVVLSFGSKIIVDFFKEFGIIPRKTLIAKLEKDSHLNVDTIRGLLEGDGSISQTKDNYSICVGFTSASKDLILQYIDFLNKNLNINIGFKTIKPRDKKAIIRNREVDSKHDLFYVNLFGKTAFRLLKILYTNKKFFITRKHEKAIKIIEIYEKRERLKLERYNFIIGEIISGKTDSDIAKSLGISASAIKNYKAKHNIRSKDIRKLEVIYENI